MLRLIDVYQKIVTVLNRQTAGMMITRVAAGVVLTVASQLR